MVPNLAWRARDLGGPRREVQMRRLFIAAAAFLFSCEGVLAQSVINSPGMGATSPLGILGSTSPGLTTGIPLGATEIDPGGLGPTPIGPMSTGSSCLGTTSSSSSGTAGGAGTGTTSSFDGGGMGSAVTSSSCSLPSSNAVSSAGAASPLSNPGASATTSLNGGVVPLGATEINSAGISALIGIPAPSITVTPCIGSTTNGLMSGSLDPSSLATGSMNAGGTASSGC